MQTLARLKWPILLVAIGISCGILAVISLLGMFGDSGTSILAPGEVSVRITKPGEYTLWHETKGFVAGQYKSFPDDLPPGTTIKVVQQPGGTPVSLYKGGTFSLESGGTRRVSVGQVTFTRPGQYRVAITGLTEKHAFYLDEAKFLRTMLRVLLCGSTGMLFLLTGIGTGAYMLVQSSKRAR